MGFCPEDRKAEGIIEDLSVRENIILALQARNGIFGSLSRKKQEEIADRYVRLLDIKVDDTSRPIRTLSGGNQQKAILARWLATGPKFLILDEPTRGIDVGAKGEIKSLIRKLSSGGMSILFISSELDEIIASSSRVAILRDKKKIGELEGDDIDEKKILYAIAHGDTGKGAKAHG